MNKWMANSRAFFEIYSKKNISILARISLDSNIEKKTKINRFVRIINSVIGSYSYVGPGTKILNSRIGRFCSISWGCNLGLLSHNTKSLSTSPLFSEKRNGVGISWVKEDVAQDVKMLVIGNDVWIGANAIIMNGLNIGDGAVIGAGAVVTRDVEPYAIVAGNPAKIIKMRFSPDVVGRLLEKQWWSRDENFLKANLIVFSNQNLDVDDVDERF